MKVKQRLIQYLLSRKEEEGFTLVELIVVVMIIGILSSIAIPSFMNAGDKAKQKEASLLLSSYLRAAQSYYSEYSSNATHSGHLAEYITITGCERSDPSFCKTNSPQNLQNQEVSTWFSPSGLYQIQINSMGNPVSLRATPAGEFNGYPVTACFNSGNGVTRIVESATRGRDITVPDCGESKGPVGTN